MPDTAENPFDHGKRGYNMARNKRECVESCTACAWEQGFEAGSIPLQEGVDLVIELLEDIDMGESLRDRFSKWIRSTRPVLCPYCEGPTNAKGDCEKCEG